MAQKAALQSYRLSEKSGVSPKGKGELLSFLWKEQVICILGEGLVNSVKTWMVNILASPFCFSVKTALGNAK